jgi:hypothetical protein
VEHIPVCCPRIGHAWSIFLFAVILLVTRDWPLRTGAAAGGALSAGEKGTKEQGMMACMGDGLKNTHNMVIVISVNMIIVTVIIIMTLVIIIIIIITIIIIINMLMPAPVIVLHI